MGLRPTQEDKKHANHGLLVFVSGHDFSRAAQASLKVGFSPCWGSRHENWVLEGHGFSRAAWISVL